MGDKALEVGFASQAAGIFFTRVKEERDLSEKAMMRGVGMTAKGRINRLLTGTGVWTLDDVQAFSTYLKIPTKTAYSEIMKEMHLLISEKNCPQQFLEECKAC